MGTAKHRSAPAHHDTGRRAGISNIKNLTRLSAAAPVMLPNLTHDVLHRESVKAAATRAQKRQRPMTIPGRWGKAYNPDPSEFEDTARSDGKVQKKEPPVSNINPEVAAIVKERGVSISQAYSILRRERIAEVDPATVPQPIRDRILVVVATLEQDENPDSQTVTAALNQMGFNTNDHDVTHVLWSLNKTEHIKMRVSGRRGLHNIRLTAKGEERARMVAIGTLAIDTPLQNAVGGVRPQDTRAQYDAAHPRAQHKVNGGPPSVNHVWEALPEGGHGWVDKSVVDPTGEAEAAEVADAPTEPDPDLTDPLTLDPLADYPLVRDLLARAKAESAYVTVAKAVEALGEDDMALTLLSKVQLTPLEEQVARLLASLGVEA